VKNFLVKKEKNFWRFLIHVHNLRTKNSLSKPEANKVQKPIEYEQLYSFRFSLEDFKSVRPYRT